jgi:methionine sulfoxide reductase heme-binding subunit
MKRFIPSDISGLGATASVNSIRVMNIPSGVENSPIGINQRALAIRSASVVARVEKTVTPMTSNQWLRFIAKPGVFLASITPAAWLLWAASTGQLSANPLAELTNETGVWALRFLCLTLTVTPLRRLTRWNDVIRFRRMLGLFAFFYGSLHLSTYVIADRLAALDFQEGLVAWKTAGDLVRAVGSDVLKRPFITVGFSAWLCLLLLAMTSTTGMIRRLGGRRWQALHRLTYVAAAAGVLHYWWLVKADLRRPQAYALVVGGLLAFRAWRWARTARTPMMARAAA